MKKIIWRGPKQVLESAITYFTEIAAVSDHPVGLKKDNPDLADDAASWSIEVYFDKTPDLEHLTSALCQFEPRWNEIAPGEIEEIPQKDWVAHSLEGLGVIEAGRFLIYGVHDTDKAEVLKTPDTLAIRIDANQAFGTGHHPTTEGCLSLLNRLAGFAPKSILDLGCGSAVLAIAAAKLWGRDVLASDIDPDSVDIAKENAALNDVGEHIDVVCAAGFDSTQIVQRAPFDFIFANILAGPLKELAPQMNRYVGKNGRVMLAGLMAEQEAAVIAAYEEYGFSILNRLDHETWPVLLLVHKNPVKG